jgi:hypothetical protein
VRRTPIERKTGLKRGGPPKPYSARRRKRDSGYLAAREQVRERAEGRCEAVTGTWCNGQAEQVHHLAGRDGVDPHRLSNLLAVCHRCHLWIEGHREESYARGWLVRRLGGAG